MSEALPEQIAPAVWKFSFGRPEEITPFRVMAPVPAAFDSLPTPDTCPIAGRDMAVAATRRGFEVRLPLGAEERVYGLGLQLLSFEQTGLKKTLRVNSDPRADLGDSHAPVPFYVTSGGYGVLIDTARYATFYCGSASFVRDDGPGTDDAGAVQLGTQALYAARAGSSRKQMVIEIPGAEGVEILVFGGPGLREAVQRYNLFSGGGVLPPRWALGVAYRVRADFDQDAVLEAAESLRAERMPCDVLGLEPGWQSGAYPCTHVWNAGFPDPAGMLADLRSRHLEVNLWTHAFTSPQSPLFKPLLPHAGETNVFGGLVPDFLQPGAEELFAAHYHRVAVEMGVSGLKLDECDNSDFIKNPWSFPEFARFPSGADGEQMHSLFGLLQQRMIDRLYRSADRRTFGLVRSSQAFAAPLPFSLYSDLYAHRDFIRGMVTASFSGLLWVPEIREATSGADLLRRLQGAVVSAGLLINAWYIKNPPWKQWNVEANNRDELLPDAADWQDKCRRILELRMRLVPYLHAAFHRYATEGLPPFRPLVMDYPDEKESWTCDGQIMVGDRLMSVPLLAEETKRAVWLPPGTWFDFWSGERLEGGRTIEIEPALEFLPLYVKDGAILPLARPTLHTADPVSRELEVQVYGNGAQAIILPEEAEPDRPFGAGALNRLEVAWDAGRKEIVTRRGQAGLPPFYSIVSHVQIG